MPDVRTSPLVRVAQDLWVDPAEVVAVREEYFEGSQEWLTAIYLRHERIPFHLHARAESVLASLTGDLQ